MTATSVSRRADRDAQEAKAELTRGERARRPAGAAKRLLVVSPGQARGGAEDYALTIAAAAHARGWEVQAALPELEATRTLEKDFRAMDVPTRRLVGAGPYIGRRERIFGSLVFGALLARWRPHVVHLTLPWPFWAYVQVHTCALMAVPAVVVFQLVPEAGEVDIERRLRVYSWARSRRQRWIAVSDFGRRQLVQDFRIDRPDEVGVIHNGVDLGSDARRAPTAPSTEALQRSLGVEPEAQVAISVGRLSSDKGHDVLVAAAQRLARSHPRLRVLIVGEGEERGRLEAMIGSLGLKGKVRLLGRRSDVPSLLRLANVFVFPSRTEGTPFALLEAMAYDLPVVAARFGGADELIEHGRTGLLTPANDPAALAVAVACALDDPRGMKAMAQRAQAQLPRFSQENMVNKTLDVLLQAAR